MSVIRSNTPVSSAGPTPGTTSHPELTVIDQSRPVAKSSDLIPIIPPRSDDRILLRILSQPLVSRPEVVDHGRTAIRVSRGEHDRGRRIGVRGDPGTVVDEHDQRADERGEDGQTGVQAVDSRFGRFDLFRISSRGLLLPLFVDYHRISIGIHIDGRNDRVHVRLQQGRKRHGRRDADDRGDDQHQPDHDPGEIRAEDGVDDDKEVFIPEFPEAEEDSGGEEEDEHLEVEEEGRPGGGLMLRDRGDDGNCRVHIASATNCHLSSSNFEELTVNLGVTGIPQRVKPPGPRRDPPARRQQDQHCQRYGEGKDDKRLQE